jgi:hypothetical protein
MNCSIDGCGNVVVNIANQLCGKHYSQIYRNGKINTRGKKQDNPLYGAWSRVKTDSCERWRYFWNFVDDITIPQDYENYIFKKKNKSLPFSLENWSWKKRDFTKLVRTKRKYNYDTMYGEQNGCCAICQKYFNALILDHCHTSGNIRKLLCNGCNTCLGKLKEDVEIIKSMISYLQICNVTDKEIG